MTPLPPPRIERRSYDDFVAQTEELLARYAGWRPASERDPGGALVRIFARMAELVADRMNQVPEKNFLAFLDLLGVSLRPPQPARVPLTFFLAAGSGVDAVVPARTQVAALPLEGDTEPVIFETERELVVTRSTLAAALTRDPEHDRYADHSPVVGGADPGFRAFTGDLPLVHRLELGHAEAFGMEGPKTVAVHLHPEEGSPPWLRLLEWSYRDGDGEHRLEAVRNRRAPWTVTLPGVPTLPEEERGGRRSTWISARLAVPLRERGVRPRRALAGGDRMRPDRPLHPFGRERFRGAFYLDSPAVFAVPGAELRIRVELDESLPPAPEDELELVWEYSSRSAGKGTEWRTLGHSTPGKALRGWSDHDLSDGTLAFTRDGTVSFRVPADWTRAEHARRSGFWLRARVAAGGFGGRDDFRPPVVRRLELEYDLEVPPLLEVRAQVRTRREGRVPRAGYAGSAALDLTKDFFPFGEKPRPGDTLYLALPELAGKPGAEAVLTVEPGASYVPTATPPVLHWEFWNRIRKRWERLGESGPWTQEKVAAATHARRVNPYDFQDGTRSFTAVTDPQAAVTFRVPPEIGEVEVNGVTDVWVRVRIASGDYGKEATYEAVTTPDPQDPEKTVTVYQPVPATFRPPLLQALKLAYRYASRFTHPEVVAAENDFTRTVAERRGMGIAPFTPFRPSTEERPALYLGFERPGSPTGFANRTTTLYFGVAQVLYGEEGEAGWQEEPAAVTWWYWNGAEWARLGVRDETHAFTRRGVVTFVGPPDFRASREFGREAFWLRARLERGGYRHPPRLERVLTNTTWGENSQTVTAEVLGSSSGRPGQSFRASRAPVLPGERLEVRELELPSAAEREALVRELGEDVITTVTDAAGRPVEVWVRWSPVPDFHGSGPRSRHYVLDRLTGEVRFGDGKWGMIPPQARSGVRLAAFRTGGGPGGNRAAGNVAQLRSAVPYVDRVTNPEPSAGGSAAESLESVKVRGPRTLRHRGRAVTLADLEDLAMEASTGVALARAIPPRTEEEAGSVRVIVVPRSTAPQPVPSVELLDRVESFLKERVPATVELEVLGPEWVRVEVEAEVVPASLEGAGEVQLALEARLAAFLHPLTGGTDGTGWRFGRKPYRSDLFALAEATPGVDHVRRLAVTESGATGSPFFLVHPGTHRISLAGSTDL